MKVVKGNKVYKIEESQSAFFESLGYKKHEAEDKIKKDDGNKVKTEKQAK